MINKYSSNLIKLKVLTLIEKKKKEKRNNSIHLDFFIGIGD